MQLSSSLPCGIAFGQPSSKHESDIHQALQQQQQQPAACNKAEPSSTRIEKLKSAAASTERLPSRCSAQEPGQIVGQPGAAVGVPVGGVAHKGELSKPEPAACIMNAGETPQTTALPCTLTMLRTLRAGLQGPMQHATACNIQWNSYQVEYRKDSK